MDDPLPVFQRELVSDLRDAVWEKMEENHALLDENKELLDNFGSSSRVVVCMLSCKSKQLK
jgi:regulator of replication initiation timing